MHSPADPPPDSALPDIDNETLLLANEAIVAPLLAGSMVHDVRGGLGEAMMAVTTLQVVLQAVQRGLPNPDALQSAFQRLQFVRGGCARASAALDAWSSALGGPLVDGDTDDVDLRDVLLELPALWLLPVLTRMVECEVTAGERQRWIRGSRARLCAALAGVGQLVIARAAEGAHFTCRFIDENSRQHAIEMAIDVRDDSTNTGDQASPDRNATRAQVALRATRAAIAACGGVLTTLACRENGAGGYRVAFPAAGPPE